MKKKLEVFCIFGISTHLSFLGSIFSFFSVIFHFFIICFSYFYRTLSIVHHLILSISHHVLCFFHWFPVFCSIFDQKNRKKWRTLSKIQGVWAQDRNMKKKMIKKKLKKWKINEKNSRFFAFLGFQPICLFLALIFHVFHLFFIFLSFAFRIVIVHCHFYSFLIIFFVFVHWCPVFCSIFDQ